MLIVSDGDLIFCFPDTQGFADNQGRDGDFIQDLATTLMADLKSVNVFLLLFKGTETRFNRWTQNNLRIYETVFGPKFWEHSMTEFTFWGHSFSNKRDRKRACQRY